MSALYLSILFLFHYPSPPHTYTLSLHDALPISTGRRYGRARKERSGKLPPRSLICKIEHELGIGRIRNPRRRARKTRSEEHTSELQSLAYLVCRLLLEKKK